MQEELIKLNEKILKCQDCELCENRQQAIVGDGVNYSKIMLIGEAPGATEDKEGKPFVGRSGKLLTQMLSDIGINREENLYITNTVKCRPPENRNPKQNEINSCRKYLETQIKIHNPKVIILVGNFACRYFLDKKAAITKIHGDIIKKDDVYLFPIFHPAAILRNKNLKPLAQEDFNKLRLFLDENKIL